MFRRQHIKATHLRVCGVVHKFKQYFTSVIKQTFTRSYYLGVCVCACVHLSVPGIFIDEYFLIERYARV